MQNQASMASKEGDKSTDVPYEVQIKLCSSICKKTVKHYRDHNMKICKQLEQWDNMGRSYTTSIENLEKQIKAYQTNEDQYDYDVKYARWERDCLKDKIEMINKNLTEVTCERDSLQSKVCDLENASKSVQNLFRSQIHDKFKTGLGYNNVPPPYNNNYFPPKTDIDINKLKERMSDDVKKVDPVINQDANLEKIVVTELTTDDRTESSSDSEKRENTEIVSKLKSEKLSKGKKLLQKKAKKSLEKMNSTTNNSRNGIGDISKSVKPVNKHDTVKSVNDKSVKVNCKKCNCKASCSSSQSFIKTSPRGNQRNWNQMVSQRLGQNFTVMKEKACFICGKFNHLQHDCYYNPENIQRIVRPSWTASNKVNHQNFKSKVNPVSATKKLKSKANVINTAAAQTTAAVLTKKIAKSLKRAQTAVKINTAKLVNAAKHISDVKKARHINTVSAINAVNPVSAVRNKVSWIWKPVYTVNSKVSNSNSASKSMIFRRFDYVDAQGKPRTTLVWVPKRN